MAKVIAESFTEALSEDVPKARPRGFAKALSESSQGHGRELCGGTSKKLHECTAKGLCEGAIGKFLKGMAGNCSEALTGNFEKSVFRKLYESAVERCYIRSGTETLRKPRRRIPEGVAGQLYRGASGRLQEGVAREFYGGAVVELQESAPGGLCRGAIVALREGAAGHLYGGTYGKRMFSPRYSILYSFSPAGRPRTAGLEDSPYCLVFC